MDFGGDLGWCWGSLRPWQILHSRLAETDTHGEPLDVWELIDEALLATDPRVDTADGGDIEGGEYDGEFWGHGGVMEGRIREWLERRGEAEKVEEEMEIRKCSREVITNGSRSAIARASDEVLEENNQQEEEEEEEDEDEDNEDNEERAEDEDEDEEEADYDDDNALDDHQIPPSLSFLATPPPNLETLCFSDGDNLAAFVAQDVCAVCLDKLLPEEALFRLTCGHVFHCLCLSPWLDQQRPRCPCCRAAISPTTVAALPNVAPPPDLATHYYSPAPPPQNHNVNVHFDNYLESHVSADIMCLLADMEAALESFGFRS